MESFKITKRNMLAVQTVEVMLRKVFGVTVLIGQAEIEWEPSGTGPNYEGPCFKGTVKGYTRGNIAFECVCFVVRDDSIKEWYPEKAELRVLNERWRKHIGQEVWTADRFLMDYRAGHQLITIV